MPHLHPILIPRSVFELRTSMPAPPELEQIPARPTYYRASDETACNGITASHPAQKDMEAGTKLVLEKVSTSDEEFPDGGLRAWAVVLGVGPCLSVEDSH